MAIPANTVVPAITGTVTVGSVLTTDNGTWDNVPTSYTYQWLRDGVAISGATASTYRLLMADVAAVIVSQVTATNGDGSATADSAATSAVPTTIIAEDGTVVANANSYLTLAEADTYHIGLENNAWTDLSAGSRESALRRATTYMVEFYRFKWKGSRKDVDQLLDWPRVDVYLDPAVAGDNITAPLASTIVPAEVMNACASLALSASTDTLYEDQEQKIIREKIGPLDTTFSEFSPSQKQYSSVNAALSLYLLNNGSTRMQGVRT